MDKSSHDQENQNATEENVAGSQEAEAKALEIEQEKDTRAYASFSARMLAAMLDSLIGMIPFAILGMFINFSAPAIPDEVLMKLNTGATLSAAELEKISTQIWFMLGNSASQIVILSVVVIVFWIYFAATPGKMLLGMLVVGDKAGKNPTTGQGIKRILGYFFSVAPLLLGFFWMNFDKKKRCWHDMIAGTVVI